MRLTPFCKSLPDLEAHGFQFFTNHIVALRRILSAHSVHNFEQHQLERAFGDDAASAGDLRHLFAVRVSSRSAKACRHCGCRSDEKEMMMSLLSLAGIIIMLIINVVILFPFNFKALGA